MLPRSASYGHTGRRMTRALDTKRSSGQSYRIPGQPSIRTGVPVGADDLFKRHLELIRQIIESIARRNGFDDDLCEEFRSYVYVRLLANDCARLRSYEGKASWRTYLTAVINNIIRDFRNQIWGKWRPSARAQALGPEAVFLERLIHRDGLRLNRAVELVVQQSSGRLRERDVLELYRRLPHRIRREFLSLDKVRDVSSDAESDADLLRYERTATLRAVSELLGLALEALPPEDRLIVRMSYFDGFTVADIARTLGLKQKPLYRRIKGIYRRLRAHLERNGVYADILEELQ